MNSHNQPPTSAPTYGVDQAPSSDEIERKLPTLDELNEEITRLIHKLEEAYNRNATDEIVRIDQELRTLLDQQLTYYTSAA